MRIIFVISFLSLVSLGISAQTVILKGIVTDAMGAVIPGTRVQLISSESRSSWAFTDVNGEYEIKVEPGKYTVSFVAGLFVPFELKDFLLTTSKMNRIDVILKPRFDVLLIEDLTAVPEPIEIDSSNKASRDISSRPVLGMSRYCGTVRDELGAAIPNVFLSLKPDKRSKSLKPYEFKTDADGHFDFVVPDGVYKIIFRMESFKKVELKNQLFPSESRGCVTVTLKSLIKPHQIT
jgi:hypothetical protein